MSRLDSAIRRLQAQRDCLGRAAAEIAAVSGPLFELGLGNGRTFDHLRGLMPEREIFVFDRQVAAHPDCVPDRAHLVLGDIRETLPAMTARFGRAVALVHSDIGTGDPGSNAPIAAFIAATLPPLMAVGGVAVSDQDLAAAGILERATELALPEGVRPGRYHMYRFR